MPIPLLILITDLDLGGSPLMVRTLATGLRDRGTFLPTVVSIAPVDTFKSLLSADESTPQIAQKPQMDPRSAAISPQLFPVSAQNEAGSNEKSAPAVPVNVKKPSLTLEIPPVSAPIEHKSRGIVAQMLRNKGINVESLNISSPAQLPLALHRWIRLLYRLRPTIVHSILIHANALATFARPFSPPARYIQAIHTLQDRPQWHWNLQGAIAGRADGLVAPHPAILARIAQYGPFDHARIIPNGIDLQRFSPQDPTPPKSPPNAPRTIGYIGRFDPVKRLPTLLDAFARVRKALPTEDLRLSLVGYGPQEAALRQQVAALNLTNHVVFPGPTSTPEIVYKSFDILCLPSDAEGFGLTIVEALATGIPVVAIATPAMCSLLPAELLTGPNAVAALAPDATPQSLATALIQVMTNPAAHSPASITARRALAEIYSQEKMIDAYENYLRIFSTA